MRTINDVDYIANFGTGTIDGQATACLELRDGADTTTLSRLDVCSSTGRIRSGKSGRNIVEEHHKVLWSDAGMYMTSGHRATLSEKITAQNNGIVLVWSAYSSGAGQNWNWNMTFVPKQWVTTNGGNGVTCHMSGSNFGSMGCKYVYVNDGYIQGNDANTHSGTSNGITYNNASYVLRYVIGV